MAMSVTSESLMDLVSILSTCKKVTVNNALAFIRDYKLNRLKEHYDEGFEAIISKDGKIGLARPSHVNALIGELDGMSKDEFYETCPVTVSPVEELVKITGAISVWQNTFLAPPVVTDAQKRTLELISSEGLVSFSFIAKKYIDMSTVESKISKVLEMEYMQESNSVYYYKDIIRANVSRSMFNKTSYVQVEIGTKHDKIKYDILGQFILDDLILRINLLKKDLV